jgi:uncharacterized phage-associated protein
LQISFHFNLNKSIAAMAHILQHLGRTEKVKLMKLLYLADREHFVKTGVPITGDRLFAMPWGPVPSCTLDAVGGALRPREVFKIIHTDDNWVMLRDTPDMSALSPDEIQTLEEVVKEHGHKKRWSLVRETHRLPEYRECYVPGTSTPIPYETIARFSGNDARYRYGRAVISPQTAAAMPCPFEAGSDADL